MIVVGNTVPSGHTAGRIFNAVDTKKDFYCLKYQRTEYAKKIRKQYEAGEIKEKRCNMREWTTRKDGLSNTLTTVQKDNYILEIKSE